MEQTAGRGSGTKRKMEEKISCLWLHSIRGNDLLEEENIDDTGNTQKN